ncbi:MAG TPA: glycosyltransferase family 2 protein [Thermoanaerobaculia bacterium]|nr:glycosyltransferase family 2 protein [Thermoanaerobaculia bacterium]
MTTTLAPPSASAPSASADPQPLTSRACVSALVTTFNEERHIGECLESLSWCDEVLVVDSFSTDRTPEIARRFPNVRFVQRTYFGSASQKNWAMDQATYEWILIFDADERCTAELRREIQELLAQGPPPHEAYTIRRRVYFLGQVIRFSGWQRDQVVRLLLRGAGRYPNRRVHADMVTRGKAPLLRNPMLHFMVDDFVEYAGRIQRYSWWGAAQAWREGKSSGPLEIFGRTLWRFLRTYFLQLGILDGMRGMVFCLLQAYGTYLKWSFLWSWRLNSRRGIEPNLPKFDDSENTWRGVDELENGEG